MAEQMAQARPLSPEQAADVLRDAGKVSGLAQIAILGHADEIAVAQSVRFKREALRLARKYGAQSPRAIGALSRIDLHNVYRRALARELARATVPVPAVDAAAATLYGRVLGADDEPQRKFVVQALDSASGKTAGRAVTGSDGVYLITIPLRDTAVVTLSATAPKAKGSAVQSDSVAIANGARVFRDLRIVPQRTPPSPQPDGDGTRPRKRKMPDLVGMSEADARTVLTRLGVSSIKVAAETAPGTAAGIVLKQAPVKGAALKASANIALVISEQAPLKTPDLRKMTLAEAIVVLTRLGLKVGEVSGDRARGKIIRQTPPAGANAALGSAVDIKLRRSG
jgi:PASTA domain